MLIWIHTRIECLRVEFTPRRKRPYDLIYVIRKQRLPNPKAKTIEFRTTKNLDVNSFVKDLEEIPWESAYAYGNIDDIWIVGPHSLIKYSISTYL